MQDKELESMLNPILYHRGLPSNKFYLIISGKVSICSGNEGFFMEKGAFNFMGEQSLSNPTYVPDFSAKVLGKARLLQITREDYLNANLRLINIKR